MNKNIALLFCGLSVLAACGGDGSSGGGGSLNPASSSTSTSSSSSSSSAAPVGKFIYIPNRGASTITAYAINATTGALTAVPGAPFPTGANNYPLGVSLHPSGAFLYASNLGDTYNAPSVSAFTVNNTTGSLSPVLGSPFPVGLPSLFPIDGPMQHPDGKFLYIRKANESPIFGYAVNQTSGALTPLASSQLPTAPLPGKFNSTNKLYYVPMVTPSHSMGIYAVDSITGVGNLLNSAVASQPVPMGIPAFDAANKYLYSASSSRVIFGYSINASTGLLTTLPGSPYSWPAAQGGTLPNIPPQVTVHPSGRFVFVLDQNMNGPTIPLGNSNITVYNIDQTTGALAAVGMPVSTGGTYAVGMQFYKNGQFLLVTNRSSGSVAIFGINLNTGALTPAAGSPFQTPGSAPGIVIIDPSGKFAYLTDELSNTITEFTIDATAGTITTGPNYPTGPTPSPSFLIVGLQ